MKQIKNYMGTLCSFYMLVLLVGLPLYTGGSYYLLGDRKYLLFRNASILCIGIWLLMTLVTAVIYLAGRLKDGRRIVPGDIRPGLVDICMISYAGCVLLSTFHSSFPVTAWLGYRDWYMGALSQLLFVGIYFFVSREYSYQAYPLYLGETVLLAVVLIGLLQRLDIDILGLMRVYNERDWEYSHMLSTVGNINWLSSYLGMALPFAVSGFLYTRNRKKGIFLYLVSVMCLIMLWVQGSDGGALTACLALAVCLGAGLWRTELFLRGLLLGTGMCFGLPLFAWLVKCRDSAMAMPADGNSYERIAWAGWWAIGAVLLLLWLIFGRMRENIRRKGIRLIMLLGAFTFLAGGIYALCRWFPLSPDMDWGNGRGTLWKRAWWGFLRGDLGQKLLGAGPDCFGEVLYTANIMEDGHWQGAIFANAHNEWLNQLINLGVLGTVSYFAIFAGSLWRYRRMLLGVLTVVLYGAVSLFSFQQVMNAPYLFLILGLCESRLLKEKQRARQELSDNAVQNIE
ncbi:MAG: O-antigen ligase family protein [Roseburia sp.]|nr:O-antigen ligase family protein [Roseburia sp.]